MTTRGGGGDGSEGSDGRSRPSARQWWEVGIDFDRANAARIYDYFLGGAHNFAVDRAQAARILAARSDIVHVAQANRAYLRRVVDWCLQHGLDQFLDLGSGVPTVGNVHEIAHRHEPRARVAYVDFEPVAVAHAQEIIADAGVADRVTVTRADLRDPAAVLGAPTVAELIDLTRPVAVLAVAVLHFVPDDLVGILAGYRAALSAGSAVAISHAVSDDSDPEISARIHAAAHGYDGSATEITLRSRADLLDVLSGLDLVAPGLLDVTEWPAPQPDVDRVGIHGALARLPHS